MSEPRIRDCEHFVVLEPGKPEKFLTAEETLNWLEKWLNSLDTIPFDLSKESSISDAAKKLLDTACDLEIEPGIRVQWFAVRIDHQN
tara:strand:- start:34278 stop:34538 length:261 start_codon:yes stop_codon:yes gene_type:complete